MSSTDLQRAYQAILDQFVEPVDHRQLIDAATAGLRESLGQRQLLPLFTLPLDLQPRATKNPARDWRGFAAAYDAVVQKQPQWAAEVHPDWLVIRQMVATLNDGHSFFRTPEEVQRSQETTYAGIGVGLAASENGDAPLVSEVFPNSPAERGGLRRGDRIVAVDGQELAGRPLADVVQLIRGPTGSNVGLRVRRLAAGNGSPMDVRLTRAQVQVDPVVARPSNDGTLGYLRIRNFNSEVVGNATRQVLQNGARLGLKGWIVDLRGNSGGLMTVVTAIAGAFVDQQVIGYEVDRQANRVEITSVGPALVRNAPLVVLIDRDSASGAEILAAALRDYAGAQLIGVNSAGNVAVAVPVDLADGSRVQVSVRRYESGKGEKLEKVGVKPDEVVEQRDADLEAGRDTQLSRATELLVQAIGRR